MWFGTVHLSSGYYQVGMGLSDASKTAFATSKGLFEFKRMLMGLPNTCATFERLMGVCHSRYAVGSLNCLSFLEHFARLQTVFFCRNQRSWS